VGDIRDDGAETEGREHWKGGVTMPNAKPKWGTGAGWAVPFKLGEDAKRDLIELTGSKVAAKLEDAAGRFVGHRTALDADPRRAELRQAMLHLQKWAGSGLAILPEGEDPTLDVYGWDYGRLRSFKAELTELRTALATALTDAKAYKGTPVKTAQRLFARHVAHIIRDAGLRVTSTRNGVFSKALTLLLDAAKETKDTHRLVELTVKELQ
jgi:hypothetical protein